MRCRADCESALRALCIQPDSQSGGLGKANVPEILLNRIVLRPRRVVFQTSEAFNF